jgi:hypothetical protein
VQNQLLVNGAFVADKVLLDRTYSSLRYSHGGEHSTTPNASATNCGQGSVDAGTSAVVGDCAAEIFNYTPELYLAQPASQPTSGPTLFKYDALTSLPPVF